MLNSRHCVTIYADKAFYHLMQWCDDISGLNIKTRSVRMIVAEREIKNVYMHNTLLPFILLTTKRLNL